MSLSLGRRATRRVQPEVEARYDVRAWMRVPLPLWAGAGLTACGKTQAAFDRRSIPPEPRRFAALCVAFRSKYTRYSSLTRLVSRAPHRARRSREFHHRLLTACGKTQAAFGRRSIPPEPPRFAALCVALRSKYTRYSSLARLVSRAPRPHRENWPLSALTRVSPQAVTAAVKQPRRHPAGRFRR